MNNDGALLSGEQFDPLNPESHEPNPDPPSADPSFYIHLPNGGCYRILARELRSFSRIAVPDCYIVSTGHGTSGPFVFAGVALLTLVEKFLNPGDSWHFVEVISADGFGTRLSRQDLLIPDVSGPILLADDCDGRRLTREQGLIRLIVPNERDDALMQVKWVENVNIVEKKS